MRQAGVTPVTMSGTLISTHGFRKIDKVRFSRSRRGAQLRLHRLHSLKVEQSRLLVGTARYLNQINIAASSHFATCGLSSIKTTALKVHTVELHRDRHRGPTAARTLPTQQ